MTDLPPGWEWATLEDLAGPMARAITDGPFGSNLKSEHYTENGARVIRLQNIGDGHFRDERTYISLARFEALRTHEVRPGDLVIASLGQTPPRACLVPALGGPAIVKADCIRVRLSPHVDSRWVLHVLTAPQTKELAANLVRGVSWPRLGLDHIRALRVPVPPLPEQRRIVATLEEYFSRLEIGIQALEKAVGRLDTVWANLGRVDQLRRSLLLESFAGRLIPQNPNDESASVLLERIKEERAAQPKAKRGRAVKRANPDQESML